MKTAVLIVGGGPAGSAAARALRVLGVDVTIVEKASSAGSPVRCAEYVPMAVTGLADLEPQDIAQRITGMQTFIDGRLAHHLPSPGLMLHRRIFDKRQVEQAEHMGARLLWGVRATAIAEKTVRVKSKTAEWDIAYDYLIGADGPRSLVGRLFNNAPMRYFTGVQYTMPLHTPQEHTEVYFSKELPGGYYWIFPKGDTANVGLGIDMAVGSQAFGLLDAFCARKVREGRLGAAVVNTTGGLIPYSGMVEKVGAGRRLVAGDAAGCTHPVTGAGIMPALLSGKLAAGAVWKAITLDSPDLCAAYYQATMQEELAHFLFRATVKAQERQTSWGGSEHGLEQLIRRTWVTFPEYYRP